MTDKEKPVKANEGNRLPRVAPVLDPGLHQRISEEAAKQYMTPSRWIEDLARFAIMELDKRAQPGNEQPPQEQPEKEPPKKDDGGIF